MRTQFTFWKETKAALLTSMLLNVIFMAWIMLSADRRTGRQVDTSGVLVRNRITPSGTPHRAGVEPLALQVKTTGNATFDWHQVESEDYRRYIANLRAIGCPEKTVKDIVVADVNDLFASRVTSITKTNRYQYWKGEPLSRSPTQENRLRDLYAEKREVLKALGFDGSDFGDLLSEAFRDKLEEQDLQLQFLPAGKRQVVKETLFQAAQEELAHAQGADGGPEDQMQAHIKSVLTPEEFREYELRASMDALQLRGLLDPLGLTEQEYRVIFDSWRNLKSISPGTAEYRDTRQATESALQQLLGPDRFGLYLEKVKLLGYSN